MSWHQPFSQPFGEPFAMELTSAPISGGESGGATPTDALIASISAASVRGVYEHKPEYLFGVADGTLPVTTAGERIGRRLDLSGAGGHMTAIPAERPEYGTADGLHFAHYFGNAAAKLTSVLSGSYYNPLHMSGGWISIVARLTDTTGGTQEISTTRGGGAADPGLAIRRFAANETLGARLGNGTTQNSVTAAANSLPINTTRLIVAEYTGAQIRIHVNTTIVSATAALTPDGVAFSLTETPVSAGLGLRIYGVALSSAPLDSDRLAILRGWANSVGGLSL